MNIFVNLESGEGVMVFTENEKITPEVVLTALRKKGVDIIEAYEVPDHDVQYYIYEPLWLTPKTEEVMLSLAA